MKNIALIFPGQGAQTVGMGKALYDAVPASRAVFEQAQDILGNDILDVIFHGPEEKLKLTSYCQPAIVTFSLAALAGLKQQELFKTLDVRFTAGLSLGEYSALIASGALSFKDGLRLVQQRGVAMDDACQAQQGAMAAVIGLAREKLTILCQQAGVEVANFNSLEQIVISGPKDKVANACEIIQQAGAKSVIPLSVAGAFHSSLMQSAADVFKKDLDQAHLKDPTIAIVGNVDAIAQTNAQKIRDNLYLQITSSVQWVSTVQYISSQGVKDFIEIGPGRVLKGLIRKIDPSLNVYNIQTPEDIEKLQGLLTS